MRRVKAPANEKEKKEKITNSPAAARIPVPVFDGSYRKAILETRKEHTPSSKPKRSRHEFCGPGPLLIAVISCLPVVGAEEQSHKRHDLMSNGLFGLLPGSGVAHHPVNEYIPFDAGILLAVLWFRVA